MKKDCKEKIRIFGIYNGGLDLNETTRASLLLGKSRNELDKDGGKVCTKGIASV